MQYTTALVNTKKTALVGLVEMLQLVLMISIYRTKLRKECNLLELSVG